MGNAVLRWTFEDPFDTDPDTRIYHFPMNPREMTSIFADRSVTSVGTLMNKRLFYEGASNAKQFTFSGPVLNKDHYDALLQWTYERKRRIYIHDHYGRRIECVLQSCELVPKRRTGYYYSHEYTVTALVASLTDATVPNEGYSV